MSFKNGEQGVHIMLLFQMPRGEKKNPNSRKKIYKALASCAQIKEFPAYRAYEEYKIAPVLKTLAKEKDITLANDVISLLIQYCGANIRDLDMQLEKIKAECIPKKANNGRYGKRCMSFGRGYFFAARFNIK